MQGMFLHLQNSSLKQQTVWQPWMEFHLHPISPEETYHRVHFCFSRIDLSAGGRLAVVGSQEGRRLLSAQSAGKEIRQPLGMAVTHRRVLRGLQAALLTGQGSEYPVDQAGSAGILGGLSSQIHRLTNGSMVWYSVKEKHLICSKPQGVADTRLHFLQLHCGQPFQIVVQEQLVLKHTKKKPSDQAPCLSHATNARSATSLAVISIPPAAAKQQEIAQQVRNGHQQRRNVGHGSSPKYLFGASKLLLIQHIGIPQ